MVFSFSMGFDFFISEAVINQKSVNLRKFLGLLCAHVAIFIVHTHSRLFYWQELCECRKAFIMLYLYLFWWGGHCCPVHCDLFQIYCAPPNLGIARTWMWRLKFAHRPIFSAWNLRLGTLSLKSLPEDLCSGFLRTGKTHRPQSGLNPRTLDLEASTLPRDQWGRHINKYF